MDTQSRLRDLYRESGNEILRMCFLYLKDYQLAEDAVQETFIRALEKADTFRGSASIKTWVTRIAINTCKNMKRGDRYRMEAGDGEAAEEAPDRHSAYDELLEKSVISRAIMNLPDKDREILILFYYQELSQKEIAKVLGILEGTVSQRVRRAKDRLREILKEEGYEYEAG